MKEQKKDEDSDVRIESNLSISFFYQSLFIRFFRSLFNLLFSRIDDRRFKKKKVMFIKEKSLLFDPMK